jgi:hypothetical protein
MLPALRMVLVAVVLCWTQEFPWLNQVVVRSLVVAWLIPVVVDCCYLVVPWAVWYLVVLLMEYLVVLLMV